MRTDVVAWVFRASQCGRTHVPHIEVLEPRRLLAAVIVASINPNGDSNPHYLTAFNNGVVFSANDGPDGNQPYFTDGNTVTRISTATGPNDFLSLGDHVLFIAADPNSGQGAVYTTDGTVAGTVQSWDGNPTNSTDVSGPDSNMVLFNGTVYAIAYDDETGNDCLITLNASGGNPTIVADLSSDFEGVSTNLVATQTNLYFGLTNSVGQPDLWQSNGTAAGTHDIGVGLNPQNITAADSWAYCTAGADAHLLSLSGQSITPVTDAAGDPITGVTSIAPVDGNAVFIANKTGTSHLVLWSTQIGVSRANVISDPNSAGVSFYPTSAITATSAHAAYYDASDGLKGDQPWFTDGINVQLVGDVNLYGNSLPTGFVASNTGAVFFSAYTSNFGQELYETTVTSSTGITILAADIDPGLPSSAPTSITPFNDMVLFAATDGVNGNQLFRYTAGPNTFATLNARSGKLTITGTNDNDVITVNAGVDGQSNPTVVATIVTKYLGLNYSQSFHASQVLSIEVDTLDGADNVTIGNGVIGCEIVGGTGNSGDSDYFTGGQGNDTLIGGIGTNNLEGGSGNDSLQGGPGGDTLGGGPGNDTIVGGPGDDSIQGGQGDDEIHAGQGDDNVFGGKDNDLIYGGEGNDDLAGGQGNDTIAGGPGDDTLLGGAGNNELIGAAGNDLIYARNSTADTIDGGTGINSAQIDPGLDSVTNIQTLLA
jgi:ELWxxDGT repeat protein